MSSMIRAASRRCCTAATAAARQSQQPTLSPIRMLHSTRSPLSPYKSSQDRESLDPRSQENTRSGRDEDVAADSGAAFDPNVTRPETSYRKAEATEGGEGDSNSLNASGANQELSKPMGDEPSSKGTGPGKEVRKGGTSRNQSAPKSGSAAKFGEK